MLSVYLFNSKFDIFETLRWALYVTLIFLTFNCSLVRVTHKGYVINYARREAYIEAIRIPFLDPWPK